VAFSVGLWVLKYLSRSLLWARHDEDPASALIAPAPPLRVDLAKVGGGRIAGGSSAPLSSDADAHVGLHAWELGVSGGGGGGSPRSAAPPPPPSGGAARDEMAALSRLTHLGKLDPAEQRALYEAMHVRDLVADEDLFREGADADDGLYLLLSGKLGVFKDEARSRGAPHPLPPTGAMRRQTSASALNLEEDFAREALCEFEEGAMLGENAVLAGLLPLRGGGDGGGAPSGGWLSSCGSKRPATLRALRPSKVLCLPAAKLGAFALASPAAIVSIILDCVSKQWRVAHALLVGYLRLETARRAASEPPGSFPAFFLGAGAPPHPCAGEGGAEDHPAPAPLPEAQLRAAADRVVVLEAGDDLYAEGAPAGEVFVVLRGFAAARRRAPPRRGGAPRDVCAFAPREAPPGFPGAAALLDAGFTFALPALRALGPGSIAGGPAFLNGATHRETLVAVTRVEVAVFLRESLVTSKAGSAPSAGGSPAPGSLFDGGDGGSPPFFRGAGGGGSFAGALPAQPRAHAPEGPPRAYVHMHLALAITRSMARLTRQLLSLGIKRVWFPVGECVFKQGDPSSGLFFIVSGRVRMQTRARAGAHAGVLPALQVDATAGDMVGEVSELAREERRDSSAFAARDTEAVSISRAAFRLLASTHATVMTTFARLLAERMRDAARSQSAGALGSPAGLSGAELACGLPYSLAAPPGSLGALAGSRRRGGGAFSHSAAGATGVAPGVAVHHPPPSPAALGGAWAAGAPALVPRHPTAPEYRTITVLPAGRAGLPAGACRAFCGRLAAALAGAEGKPTGVAHLDGLREALGPAAAASLGVEYGVSRAGAWLSEAEERLRFLVLDADSSGGGGGAGEYDGGEGAGATARAGAFAAANPWARLCVGHSDVVLLLADARAAALGACDDGRYRLGDAEWELIFKHEGRAGLLRVDLVLLQEGARGAAPADTRHWLTGGREGAGAGACVPRAVFMFHHVRPAGSSPRCAAPFAPARADTDVAQLARFLAGRAVGVVLGGGGARGLAHTGLLATLSAAGVPIDVIGGTSQGAFVAASWAKNESLEGLRAAVADLAATLGDAPETEDAGPLGRLWARARCFFRYAWSFTLPFLSANDGSLFGERIKATLGATQIEDLPGPRYFCVSSNVTDGALAVHSTGSLWGFVRASMSIIGVLPPVLAKDTGKLLVDGGYASNLPVDVLHVLLPSSVGLVIACDVERKNMVQELELLRPEDYSDGGAGAQAVAQCLSGRRLLQRFLYRALMWRLTGRECFRSNMPHMFTLFQEVCFLRHYSAMRALFPPGAVAPGENGAPFDPTRHEPAHSPGRRRGGESDEEAGSEEKEEAGGGLGGGEGEAGDDGRPALLYVRPDVGTVGILDYGKYKAIEEKGAVRAKKVLDKWAGLRWRGPAA